MISSSVSTAEAVAPSPDFSVLEAVPQGVLVFGDYGAAAPPVFVNSGMAALTGQARAALSGDGLCLFLDVAETARLREAVASALAEGEAECSDLVGCGGGARRIVLHVRLRRLPASRHVLATFEDVTRLVDAIERLVVTESHYRALTESTNDVFIVVDGAGSVRSCSPAVQSVLGYLQLQARGAALLDFVHADDRQSMRSLLDGVMGGADPGGVEVRIRHQRGSYRSMEIQVRDLRHDAAVNGIVCHLHDVTERRRAEDAITAREALLRSLSDYSYNITLVMDVAGTIRFVSGNAEREIGYRPDDLLGCNAFDYIHPDDRATAADRIRDHIENLPAARGRTLELRIRHQDGRWVWLEARTVNCNGVPGIDGLMTQMHGIDARKAVEAEMSRMRALVTSAVGVARVGAWEYDVQADRVEWLNDEYFRIVGEDPVTGRIAHRHCRAGILDEDWPAMEAALTACLTGQTELFECEYRVCTAGGEDRWLLDRGRVIARDGTGRSTRMGGVTLDIDERKRAEIALRESERRFETVLWSSGIAFWITDADVNILEVSAQFETVTRSRVGQPGVRTARQLLDHIHPEDREAFARQVAAHLRGEADDIDIELRFRGDDGRWSWLHNRGRAIEHDDAGRATRLAGTVMDVTSRREVEEHHRMQASMLQALSEGVLVCDDVGRVTYGNAAASMMLGLDPTQLIGQRIEVLLPPAHGDWRWSEPFNGGVMSADGHPHRLETTIRQRDGSTLLVSAAVALSQFLGAPRWVVVLQNVTTQRRLERELIEVANREQERIGRDLHDGLGQELTGIALMLGGLASRVERELPAARPDVDEILDLVAQAVQSTRTLARGLSPVAIERAGLVSALRDLAARSREIMGLDVRVRSLVRPGAELDAVMATQLYRVAQEALTNVVRHAGATSATLSFKLTERMIVLSVSDDGAGVTPEALAGPGLGLKIIAYRARMMGGMALCERRPCGGTRVVVRVRRGAVGETPPVTA